MRLADAVRYGSLQVERTRAQYSHDYLYCTLPYS